MCVAASPAQKQSRSIAKALLASPLDVTLDCLRLHARATLAPTPPRSTVRVARIHASFCRRSSPHSLLTSRQPCWASMHATIHTRFKHRT